MGKYFFIRSYLFFYNTQVMASTKKVALWSAKFPNTNFCQFDNRQKAELFYSLSNQLKSFVFLILYYTPIFMTCLVIISYLPLIGTTMLMISQSFFNSAFYFLKKWPYDRYNVAFMEKNLAYMLGYGFFISFVCNVCLSGDFSRGAYFVLSQWMIINCLLLSPPEKQFKSFADVWKTVTSSQARSKLPNAYNIHRNKIRKEKDYRQSLIKNMIILKPALKITQYLNSKLANYLGQNLGIDAGSSITQLSTSSETERLSKQTDTTSNSTQRDVQSSQKTHLTVVSETYQPQQ